MRKSSLLKFVQLYVACDRYVITAELSRWASEFGDRNGMHASAELDCRPAEVRLYDSKGRGYSRNNRVCSIFVRRGEVDLYKEHGGRILLASYPLKQWWKIKSDVEKYIIKLTQGEQHAK